MRLDKGHLGRLPPRGEIGVASDGGDLDACCSRCTPDRANASSVA